MGVNYSPRTVTEGLVLHLDAGNTKSYPGTGTTWFDLSGNGNNGTFVDNVTYSTNNRGSMVFDGNTARVSLPNNITDLSGNWSINTWVKPNDDLNPRIMTIITTSHNLQVGYMSSTLVPYIRIDNSTISSTSSLSAGQWVNLTYQVNNSVRQIYINGLLTSTVSGGITANGESSAVGGHFNVYQMNGNISVSNLYNRSLTSTEINQNFNALRGRYGI